MSNSQQENTDNVHETQDASDSFLEQNELNEEIERSEDSEKEIEHTEQSETPKNVTDPAESEEGEGEEQRTPEEEILLWKETALRSKADLDNFRKRMIRERSDTLKYANQSLLEELLPVLDNFEMGMMAAAQDTESMIYKGMEMVQRQLGEFMTNQGLKEVPTEGVFDPNQHEAVSQEVNDDLEEGQIVRIIRKGFYYQEKLLRPANVIVSTKSSAQDA